MRETKNDKGVGSALVASQFRKRTVVNVKHASKHASFCSSEKYILYEELNYKCCYYIVQYYECSVTLSIYIEISQSLVGLEENTSLVCKYFQVVQKLHTYAVGKLINNTLLQVSSMPKAEVQTKGSEQSSHLW